MVASPGPWAVPASEALRSREGSAASVEATRGGSRWLTSDWMVLDGGASVGPSAVRRWQGRLRARQQLNPHSMPGLKLGSMPAVGAVLIQRPGAMRAAACLPCRTRKRAPSNNG
jgi:hypothetical protein